ncbi:MAG: Autotransporter adhesin UpaG [Bacteroidota bacterium]|nr:MAG: Autotransporter adhesin UpaG [Bacteroidota bacterium]
MIGEYNLLGSTVTNSATQFSTENTAFVIGNGTANDSRSDALTVLFDGTTNVAGSVTATAFIGDGSQLTNLSVSSPFSFNNTSGNGIQSNNNVASGNHSRAMGYDTTASGDYSTAMGAETTVSGNWSTAMGFRTKVTQNWSTAMGRETTASGNYSTVMGAFTKASDFASVVIGYYNSSGYSETSWNSLSTLAPAFVIGNGTANDSRSDALTVLFDGTTTIAGDLSINSDARLKADIISLGSTLAKLLKIDGKTYTMKKDENKKQKIGVLAQDIEKVFPELVSESNGVKSVNYQGLVPVLINALKEQDSKMNEQEAKLNKQQFEIDELKAIVNKLITP